MSAKPKTTNNNEARALTIAESYVQEAKMHLEKVAEVEIGFTVRDLKRKISQLQKIVELLDGAALICIDWRATGEMVNLRLEKAIRAIESAMRITPWVRQLRKDLLEDFDDEVSE